MASNSWRYLITFLGECRGAGIIPSRLSCFRLCKGQDGYHLTARSRFKVGGAPSNNKGWKAQYLYVISRPNWGFRLEWSAHVISNIPPYLGDEESALVRQLKGILSVDEVSVPRARPKLVRELCYARLGVDGRDYHVVRMSNLPEHDPDAPLKMHLSPLTHGTRIWQDRAASTKYASKVQIPQLATDLYTLPSKVLIDRVAKTMVLVRLVSSFLCFLFVCIDTRPLPSQSQHYHMALIDWAHDVGRVISAMDNKADGLRKEIQEMKAGAGSNTVAATEQRAFEAQSLADHYKIELEEATRRWESLEMELSEAQGLLTDSQNQLNEARELLADSQDQLKGVRARGCQMEDELLNLTGSTEALKVDLPKKVVADYKKTTEFEMGLVRTGQVSYEYGYRVALAGSRLGPSLKLKRILSRSYPRTRVC
ncbi:hypothetical protein BHE74_00003962 [Ensete ventricosum]|nr:hypothetical protein BHE74_00003962 [Ensete ventricosum]